MKKTDITTAVSRTAHKIGFILRKRSPEILVAAGVIGTVASAVMACKATLKAQDIIEDTNTTKEQIEEVRIAAEEGNLKEGQTYTEQEYKRDLAIVYVRTGAKLVKLYAPAVITGALAITSILTSHNIINKRYAAATAAYTTLEKGFEGYRKRVVERFGEGVDRELKYGIKARTIEKTVVDPKTGKEKVVQTEEKVSELDEYSDYARFFDEASRYWEKNADYNLMFLRAQQNYANDKLKACGHLFLNEVYDMLDIPRTKAGQIVGWVYDPKNPTGDNYVDFGIYETRRDKARDFVDGYERVILLDFNVDGPIIDSF